MRATVTNKNFFRILIPGFVCLVQICRQYTPDNSQPLSPISHIRISKRMFDYGTNAAVTKIMPALVFTEMGLIGDGLECRVPPRRTFGLPIHHPSPAASTLSPSYGPTILS